MPIPKYKMDKNGVKIKKFVKNEGVDINYKDLLDDLNNEIGCWLDGYLEIDKVSGNFHISFHNY